MRELHRMAWLSLAMMLVLTISAFAPVIGGLSPSKSAPLVSPENLGDSPPAIDWNAPFYDTFSQTVATGKSPALVAVGDFNNDSLPDIAVACKELNRIEIFLQKTDGRISETPFKIVQLPNAPTGMAAGDISNNGLDDLVVAVVPDKVYMLHQEERFVVNISNVRTTFQVPQAVVVGDFDGDGLNDFATVRYRTDISGSNCSLVVHPAFENFLPIGHDLNTYDVNRATGLVSHDINGDGMPDLFVSDGVNDKVLIFQNDNQNAGDSNWTLFQSIPTKNPIEMSLHDYNGNGDLDLIVLSGSQNIIRIFEYDIEEGFGLARVKDNLNSPSSATMIDVNMNGMLDLVVASQAMSRVDVFLTPTDGGYGDAHFSFPVQVSPVRIEKTDLTGNGFEDLLVLTIATATNGTLSIYYQGVDGEISNANADVVFTGIPTLVAIGDFDGDGLVEVATLLDGQRQMAFKTVEGVMKGVKSTGNETVSMIAHHLTGDNPDLIVANQENNTIAVYLGGPEFFSVVDASLILYTNLTSSIGIDIGDVSGDGKPDIVVACREGFQVFYNMGVEPYFSANSSFTLHVTGANFTHVSIADLSKFDQLGLTDVALVNSASNKIEIYTQSPSKPPFSIDGRKILTPSNSGNILWMGLGDVNNDGRRDIMVAMDTGIMVVHEQNPNFGFDDYDNIGKYSFVLRNGFLSASVGDLNDDGRDEIAVLGKTTGVVTVYKVDRAGSVPIANFTAGAGEGHVLCADLNGDLRTDIAFSSPLSGSVSAVLQKNLPPVAIAECLTPEPMIEGKPVTFSAASSTDSFSDIETLTYKWDFGDGNVIQGGNEVIEVEHVYMSDGLYTVTLTVTDREGLRYVYTLTVNVADAAPEASFTVSDHTRLEGTVVYFNDTSESYPDMIVNWTWDFGDGNVAYGPNVTHVFMKNDTYIVTLTVTDEDGSQDSHSEVIEVLDAAPTASFTVSDTNPVEGEKVYFQDTSTSFPDKLTKWHWDFGDGSNVTVVLGENQNVTHTYMNDGEYIVKLAVWDEDGSSDSASMIIVVRDSIPVPNFSWDPIQPFEGEAVQFTDLTTFHDPLVQWNWSFGDGSYSSDQHSKHVYESNGTYEVKLRVVDSDGAVAEKTAMITVKDTHPVIHELYTATGKTTFAEDEMVSLRVRASETYQSIEKYQWDFDYQGTFQADATTATNRTSVKYDQSGFYTIVVRVWDNDSFAQAQITVEVENVHPIANFGYQNISSGRILFDASLSWDTPSDYPHLEYRWNFADGGGWTPWSTDPVVEHYFSSDGKYAVTLEVRDDDGATDTYSITVTVDRSSPMGLYLMGLAGSIAFLGVVLYVRRKAAVVDDVFVIFEDGCLLSHETRRLKPGMDDDVLSSMLVAVQSFVKDSFKDEEVTSLKRLDFGEKRILVEKGNFVYLAVVLHGEGGEKVPQRMQDVLKEIEEKYGNELTDWDGDLDKLRGVKELTDRLLEIRALEGIPVIGKLLKDEGSGKDSEETPQEGSEEEPEENSKDSRD